MNRCWRRRAGAISSICGVFAGCTGIQSALDSASPQAEKVAAIGWWMFAGGGVIWIAVLLLLFAALRRGARVRHDFPLGERGGRRLVLFGGVALPAIILIALLLGSLYAGRAISTPPDDALAIEVVGWQWWWEIRYMDRDGRLLATTANEIHVPVGTPVRFRLVAKDVIHSFWVPNLRGKMDMIPGRENTAWFVAERPGIYRGQCAEYCGAQHAHMAFMLVTETPEAYFAWLERQRAPARTPTTRAERRGQEAFFEHGCDACHAIRGTSAHADLGPDLTHVASRRTLAAATLPFSRGHLGGWIADPQAIKPGNRMPGIPLTPDELQALVFYLESLD